LTEIIARILGEHSISDVREAFTLQHPERPYTSTSSVTVKGDQIQIAGIFWSDRLQIGHFHRTLRFQKGSSCAFHDMIEIEPEHRDQDIARHHYTKVLRFYDLSPIRLVRLDAEGDGPWIWPQFGFDLVSKKDKERLVALGNAQEVNLGSADDLYAADVATTDKGTGSALGTTLLRALSKPNGRLQMILRLDDPSHRAFLTARGILTKPTTHGAQNT